MAGLYSDLTDEELNDRITKFRDALEELALGGDVAKIQTDNRLMEVVRGDTGKAERILTQLRNERDLRANGGVLPGCALSMEFLR